MQLNELTWLCNLLLSDKKFVVCSNLNVYMHNFKRPNCVEWLKKFIYLQQHALDLIVAFYPATNFYWKMFKWFKLSISELMAFSFKRTESFWSHYQWHTSAATRSQSSVSHRRLILEILPKREFGACLIQHAEITSNISTNHI